MDDSPQQTLEKYWKKLCDRVINVGPIPGTESHYLTEIAMALYSAYLATTDQTYKYKYRKAGDIQFEYAQHTYLYEGDELDWGQNRDHLTASRIKDNEVPLTVFSRDAIARDIYNFIVADKVLDNPLPTWRASAEDSADALTRVFDRRWYPMSSPNPTDLGSQIFDAYVTKQTAPDGSRYYQHLYPYITGGNGNPYWGGEGLIDTNQNAELALAFTLLFQGSQTSGRWYRNSLAREIAYSELTASASIQQSIPPSAEDNRTQSVTAKQGEYYEFGGKLTFNLNTFGGIPQTDDSLRITCYDTMYHAYTLFLWAMSNQFWKNLKIRDSIQWGAQFLKTFDSTLGDHGKYYTKLRYSYIPVDCDDRAPFVGDATYEECWHRAFVSYYLDSRSGEHFYWIEEAIKKIVRVEPLVKEMAVDQVNNYVNPACILPFIYFYVINPDITPADYIPGYRH